MISKQQCAFMWSAEDLRETTGRLYFWTFTFKHTYNLWEYMALWDIFTKAFEHLATEQGLYGIRVCQLHPGGHGLHFHCLFNQYIDARRVWVLCRKWQMGCDAKKVPQAEWMNHVRYMCRYLTRDAEKFPIHIRRVGSMWGFPMHVKTDVVYQHEANDSIAYLTKFWQRGSYGKSTISACYNSPNVRGDFRTLLVALDYSQNRRMDAFQWTEKTCLSMLQSTSYGDWVTPDCTIYHPGFMPDLLPYRPF